MAKVTLPNVGNLSGNENSAIARLNSNFDAIEEAFENTLSRDGTSPNSMNADIDMNSNDLLNVNQMDVENIILDGEDLNALLLSVLSSSVGVTAFGRLFLTSENAGEAQQILELSPEIISTILNRYQLKNVADLTADELEALEADTLEGVFIDLGDTVLVRDYSGTGSVRCEWFGAVNNLDVGSAEAISVAIDVATKLKTIATLSTPGNYLIDQTINKTEGFRLHISPGVVFQQALGVPCFVISPETRYVTDEENFLASNANSGSRTATLNAGKGANIENESYVLFISTDLAPGNGHTCLRAEYAYVEDVTGDILTLSSPLSFSYTTAASAQVQNVNLIRGLEISGLSLVGGGYSPAITNFDNYDPILLVNCLQAKLINVETLDFFNTAITIRGCIYTDIVNPVATEQSSSGFTIDEPGFGYAVHESGINLGTKVSNPYSRRVRHAYTTTQSPDAIGVTMFSQISDGLTTECRGAGWDTHEPGYCIQFTDCVTRGSRDRGHQSRSVGTVFNNPVSYDCIGSAVSIEGTAEDTIIRGSTSRRCATGSSPTGATNYRARGDVWDSGKNTLIDGVDSLDSGGPVISKGNSAGNTSSDGIWRNIRGRRSNLDASGLAAAQVVAGLTGRLRIEGLDVDCAGGQANRGFANLSPTTKIVGSDADVQNAPVASGQPKMLLQPGDIFSGGGSGYTNSFGTLAVVNVVAGVIDIRGYNTAYFDVVGEGGANDDLTDIIGGEVGCMIVITAVGPNITVIHNNVKITTSTGANVGITNVYGGMVLRCVDENVWVQV